MANANTATVALDEDFELEADKELGSGRPWMDACRYELVQDLASLEEFVNNAITSGRCSVDLETEGFNSREDRKTGLTRSRIVGICLSYDKDYGVYVPLAHLDEGSINLPVPEVMEQMSRLYAGCEYLVFHHFKFDGAFLRVYGLVMEDPRKIHDTLLLSYVLDSSRMSHGLKTLSDELLNRPMIEIKELFRDKRMGVAFQTLSPRAALRYAASDAMNTLYLFDVLSAQLAEMDPGGRTGLTNVYDIERRCQIVTMEMERNYCLVDVPYFKKLQGEISQQIEDLKKAIFTEAGRVFSIGSIDQLGDVLFNKMGITYPVAERNAKGGYLVSEEILNKVKENRIVGMILKLREREKILGTYIDNLLKNTDENGCVKFQLKQTAADTGRFSSTGGDGIDVDGYSGVNCQNIPAPNPKQKDGVNIRKGILARPGYKIVSIDYSGEELRIAANLSGEKKWIDEFVYGKGDLHAVTASVIYGGTPAEMALDENKSKRSIGKSVNFLTLYGGGPGRLAEVAQISMPEASGIIEKFYEGVPQLKAWLEQEGRRSMRRGYALTSFGRRRPLQRFFADKNDRRSIQAGFRRATNGAIQGCLQPHERILTSLGYLPIRECMDLQSKGEFLHVWTGSAWAPFKVKDMGEWQTACIELENGLTVDCDTRHQVLVEGEHGYQFRRYDLLLPGDKVCVSDPSLVEFGSYPQDFSFEGTAGDAETLSLSAPSDWDSLAHLAGVCTAGGMLRGDSRALVESLLFLGCQPDATPLTKRVPEYLFRAPVSMRKEFIRGYWETDGCHEGANGCGFSAPSKKLLQGVQLILQTLGHASHLCRTNSSFRLDLADPSRFEEDLGLPVTPSPRRHVGETSVPAFLIQPCYEALKDAVSCEDCAQDYTLVNMLKDGKTILVQEARALARRYSVELPLLYSSYAVRSTTDGDMVSRTYTLSVQDEGHRYDAAGIINRNTGADVIKIAMYRVWKYIRNGGYENEIRILIPIHDEIVYEIREDLLDKHIPALVEVMRLDDILGGKLKWKVPFVTDAEYGSTFYVDHNYYKEKEAEAKALAESPSEAAVENCAQEPAQQQSSEPEEAGQQEDPSYMSVDDLVKKPPVASEEGFVLFGNDDTTPFFDYQVCKTDEIAKRQTDAIWATLNFLNTQGCVRGPKKRIRLIKDGVVVHKTTDPFSVDGFLALAANYFI